MKVMLLNDTASVPHIGCQAVSDAHARMLGGMGHTVTRRHFLGELRHFALPDEAAAIEMVLRDESVRTDIESCDVVIVNGEGTLHHGAGTEYFAVLGAAQRLGRMTLIVNAVFEAHSGWFDVLGQLDDFCVRDASSLHCAHALGLRARLVPDSMLAAQFDGPAYVDLQGRIVVTDWHPQRDLDVGRTMRLILDAVEDTIYFPMLHGIHADHWRGALAAWSHADFVLTARHHGVYLAIGAGRPFVALGSNTRKIEGLFEAAGVRIPVCTSPEDVETAMRYAEKCPGEYAKLSGFLESFLPLSTFAALGRGGDDTDPLHELDLLRKDLSRCLLHRQPEYWGLGNGGAREILSLG